jgi:hypothetical protein
MKVIRQQDREWICIDICRVCDTNEPLIIDSHELHLFTHATNNRTRYEKCPIQEI